MKATVMSVLLCLLSALVVVQSQTVPYISFMGTNLSNHSYIDLTLVGSNVSSRVQCHTDLTACCRDLGYHRGWNFPNGHTLPRFASAEGGLSQFHAAQRVDLRRSGNFVTNGIYCCDIDTNASTKEIVYVGLYARGEGAVTIQGSMQLSVDSNLSGESPQFTITCISTGGPATTVTWTRDLQKVPGGMTVLDNAETAQYTHTLIVTGRLGGLYQCTVSNNKPSTDTANLTVQVASAPTNLIAVQEGPTGIRVSWVSPNPLGYTAGYWIYYSGGSSGSVNIGDVYTNDHILTGLQNGFNYTISIWGISEHFPSDLVVYPTSISLIPEKPSAVMVTSTTATTISLSWTIPSGTVGRYELVWERDTSRKCSKENIGSVIITNGSTNYTIAGLEEDRNYTITVSVRNAAGSAVSDPVTGVTKEAVPSAPPNSVTGSDLVSFNITVSWRAVDCIYQNGDITGYSVRYGAEGSGRTQTLNVSGAANEIIISGLNNTITYTIEVAAVNSAGIGEYSAPIRVNADNMPIAVVNSTTATSIFLSWTVPKPSLRSELVWKRHMLQRCSEEDMGSTAITDGSTSYNITGLEENSTYTITVTVTNAVGNNFSDFIIEITQEAAPSAPPTSVNTSDATSSNITVQWKAVDCIHQNGDITGYSVQYSVQGSGTVESLHVSGGDATEVIISGLSSTTSYTIEVAAVNSAGTGPYSIPITAETDSANNQEEGGKGTEGKEEGRGGRGEGEGRTGTNFIATIVGIIAALLMVALFVVLAIAGLWRWRKRKESKKSYSPTRVTYSTPKESAVHHSVQQSTLPLEHFSAPEILEFPRETHAVEGESVFFQVKVKGFPRPKLTWYHNGEEVLGDYSIELAEDGTLTLFSVEVRHRGTYKFVAQNHAGRREREVRLLVTAEEEQAITKPAMKFHAIAVAFFGNHVEKNHSGNNRIFQDEYESLYNGNDKSITIAKTPENKLKNRFANTCVYDDNRVVLRLLHGYDSDYINASFIDEYSISKKYIATQGPLPETVVDFWRMVWQERAPSIVMITNLEERGKHKCQQYWPDSGTESHGPFQVTITGQQILADYTIRKLIVKLSSSTERAQKVTQFHFTAWPDHGVPDYATSILTFRRRVKKEHKPSKGSMVVHCSAGVGRTGTFITIDWVLEQIKKQGMVDIPGVIQQIREQRVNMVQTVDQYIFIHDAILESVTCGDTQIDAGNLRTSLNCLLKKNQQKATDLDLQFALLDQVSLKPSDAKCAAAKNNPKKNRSEEYLPVDQWRVVLKGEMPDYINAVNVHGYKQQRAFIITQGPLQSTARDFWKMVFDRECRVIVMLSDLVEGGQEVCYQYWPSRGSQKFGEFTVDILGQEILHGFLLRTLSIQHTKSSNVCRVNQFHITNWAPDGSCSNLKTVTDVIEEVSKVQRRTGNQPIVIHCSDTVSRCGMFCAIATTIERCKTEGVVDVFQVVKALRVQKPGAVRTVAQYQLVFEALMVYLESFSTYANF